jgi:hypothetical protein
MALFHGSGVLYLSLNPFVLASASPYDVSGYPDLIFSGGCCGNNQ